MQRRGDQASNEAINQAILYLCAFVVSATGVWAVMMMLDQPEITRTFMAALMGGFGASWFLRRFEQLHPYALLWTAGLGLVAVLRYLVTGGYFLGEPVGMAVVGDVQTALGVALAGLIIVRSYGLVRAEDLLFCVVPSLAAFGLIGSLTFDPRFRVAFLMFVFAAAFLAGQAHLMEERKRSRLPPGADARRVARERAVVLAVVFALSVAAAVPTAQAVAALAPQYEVAAMIPRSVSAALEPQGPGAPSRGLWSSPNTMGVGQGPIRLGARLLMRVRSEEPVYLRAASLTEYRGQSWARAPQRPPTPVERGSNGRFDLSQFVGATPGRMLTQTIEFVDLRSPRAFAAMQPMWVRLPGSYRGELVVSATGTASLSRGELRPGTAYEVGSQVDHLLASSDGSVLRVETPELLQIPQSARKVNDYAREAVGARTDPAAQMEAIVSWIEKRAHYTLDAPSTPAGMDPVIYFLEQSKLGYCDLFASAAALMLRAERIPARIAIGFAPGTYDPSLGAYLVRESDAHAWVEAYLPQTGWVIVDPVPVEAPPPLQPVRQRSGFERLMIVVRRNLLYAMAAAVALAWAAWSAKGRWLNYHAARRRQERALRAHEYGAILILTYERLLRVLARRGFARRDYETPGEFASRLGRGAYAVSLMPPVRSLTDSYLAARFSQRTVTSEDAQVAGQALETVKQGVRGKRQLR